MQTVSRRSRRRAKQEAQWGGTHAALVRDFDRYPHQLQFYSIPPQEEVSLEEFEMLAIERLRGALRKRRRQGRREGRQGSKAARGRKRAKKARERFGALFFFSPSSSASLSRSPSLSPSARALRFCVMRRSSRTTPAVMRFCAAAAEGMAPCVCRSKKTVTAAFARLPVPVLGALLASLCPWPEPAAGTRGRNPSP